MRFNVATQSFEAPVAMPNSIALAGQLAVNGDVVFITDFNNHVVWRYNTISGTFDSFPADAADIAVDAAGNAWFTEPSAMMISAATSRASTSSPARSPEPSPKRQRGRSPSPPLMGRCGSPHGSPIRMWRAGVWDSSIRPMATT